MLIYSVLFFYKIIIDGIEMEKVVLFVAHGSRRAESNDEVRALAEKMDNGSSGYCKVIPAFLELAEPSIPNGLKQAIQMGAKEIVVFPYFLSAGRHVVKDIPQEVNVVKEEYPEIKITITDYLGKSMKMPEIITKQLKQQ